jgi:HTH-type transcriptional regulator / antitoxin HigA
MSFKSTARLLPDTYFELVKQFPLAHIQDDKHLAEAQNLIDHLLQRDLDDGEQAYLDVLTDLVEDYEEKHQQIPDVSEADVLRELLRSHNLTQAQVAKKVGIAQSTISAVLTGARSLTKEQIIAFAQFFRVAPAAFMPASPRR